MRAFREGMAVLALAGVLASTPALGDLSAAPGTRTLEGASWPKRLEAAKQRLVRAQQHVARAQAAASHQRQRHYPRGDAKRAIEQELEKAEAEQREAAKMLPVLLEEARRAGVPPGTRRPYE